MLDATEFTHADLPGMIGLTWGGHSFTVYAAHDAAAKAVNAASYKDQLRVVDRSDGKWLIACLDMEDNTFFYVTPEAV